jgi:NADH:ubiquinone oxidoreductase subunit C
MDQDILNIFESKLTEKIGKKFSIRWDTDRKGVVCGWCKFDNSSDITDIAEIVAGFKGRVMTISALLKPGDDTSKDVEINYHFYFEGVNCTVSITLPGDNREVKSITPILKSADWHEREMQELFKVKVQGHPNPKRLFLDEGINLDADAMVPLSAAMNGTSTSTLWERVMNSIGKEVKPNE